MGLAAAGGGGAYNFGVGLVTEDGWRIVRGIFAFVGAGMDCAGDAAAEAISHGLDVAQVFTDITQALMENDPVQGTLAVFSGVAVAVDLNSLSQASDAAKKAKDAENVFRNAKANTSALARSIRAGGPQEGVKIGHEVIRSLKKAANVRDGLEVLKNAKKISAEQKESMHNMYCFFKDCTGFCGDIADFMEKLNEIEATVHVEKR